MLQIVRSMLRFDECFEGSRNPQRPERPPALGYETLCHPKGLGALGYKTFGRPERPAALGYETFGRPEWAAALGYETFGPLGGRGLWGTRLPQGAPEAPRGSGAKRLGFT